MAGFLDKSAKRTRRTARVVAAGTVGVALLAVAACSGGGSGDGSGGETTLTIGANEVGAIPQDFNPFMAAVKTNQMGTTYLIYETMLQFQLTNSPDYDPWLATAAEWSNDGKTMTFTIREGVKFNDGSDLTPEDVAFSYQLIADNPSANAKGVNATSIEIDGDDVILNFDAPQYAAFFQIGTVPIVSKAAWSDVSDPSTYQDANPVGTGPYMLENFNSQGLTLTKNPDYWQQGMPTIDNVYYPAYTSNTGTQNALIDGTLDWNANFVPNVQEVFVSKNPDTNHTWYEAFGTQGLMPNLEKWPTSELSVRQAISLAVDRTIINDQAASGASEPMANASGLTLPVFAAWESDATGTGELNVTADPDAARAVLEADGFTLDGDGFYAKDGKRISITLTNPTPWTDYAQADQIVAEQLKAVGIDAKFEGLSEAAWFASIASGDYQLSMFWCDFGITPYAMYNGWLNSALLGDGTAAIGDYARLQDPQVDAWLEQLKNASTLEEERAALDPIQEYMAENLPMIPLMTRVQFFNYSTARFTGWPNADDPYQLPMITGAPALEQIVLNLKPVEN